MTIATNNASLKEALNRAKPGDLADMLVKVQFGNVLRQSIPTTLRHKSMVAQPANSYVKSTLQALTLPDGAKALTVLRACARAGTGTPAELTVDAYGTTPSAGHIAVAPNGDIVTLTADAWTDLDVTYQGDKYDVVELTLPVVSNALTIPAIYTVLGVVGLLESEAIAGTSAGKKEVLIPAATSAAGTSCLSLAKNLVRFNGTDAITSARVKLAVASAADVDALLEASTNFI